VFLGPGDDHTNTLMQYLRAGSKKLAPSDDTRTRMQQPTMPRASLILGISHLVQSPWWRRLWTVQECLLSRGDPMVYLGRECTPLSTLARIMEDDEFTMNWHFPSLPMRSMGSGLARLRPTLGPRQRQGQGPRFTKPQALHVPPTISHSRRVTDSLSRVPTKPSFSIYVTARTHGTEFMPC